MLRNKCISIKTKNGIVIAMCIYRVKGSIKLANAIITKLIKNNIIEAIIKSFLLLNLGLIKPTFLITNKELRELFLCTIFKLIK